MVEMFHFHHRKSFFGILNALMTFAIFLLIGTIATYVFREYQGLNPAHTMPPPPPPPLTSL